MQLMHEEFKDWALSYATPLGLDGPKDLPMVLGWYPIFKHAGYSISELEKARDVVGLNPPKYRAGHLGAVHEAIALSRARQSEEDRQVEQAIADFQACKLCQGTGWVQVPHPKWVKDGVWLPYDGGLCKFNPTATVTCRCDRGERLHNTTRSLPALSLEKYEENTPGWEKLMAQWQEAQLATRRSELVAAETDKSLGKLVAEIGQELPLDAKASKPRDMAEDLGRERAMEVVPRTYRDEHVAKKHPRSMRPGPEGYNQIADTMRGQIEKMMSESYEPEYRARRDARLARERQEADRLRKDRSRRAIADRLTGGSNKPNLKIARPPEDGLFDGIEDAQFMPPLSYEAPP